ncbi:MAG: response regulator transcription factor, partial [Merismopedia sp. SIO2A8]|nr:response regulator transcription factor [Merismopedia sp. SIO2A8]
MDSLDAATTPQILLIQSDTLLNQQMSVDLTEAGYVVISALKADDGLEKAIASQPALIVVDRSLAGESGLLLCQRIRAKEIYNPLLLMMSKDTVADRIACLEAGADDYFLKPYRADN